MLLLSVFKAASLDGHMAFLVAVHYVIFYWKFCMQVWTINSSSSSSYIAVNHNNGLNRILCTKV